MINPVRTKQGLYRSVRSNAGYALFRGIPYAKPPVGCTYENRKAAKEAKEITERYK